MQKFDRILRKCFFFFFLFPESFLLLPPGIALVEAFSEAPHLVIDLRFVDGVLFISMQLI